MPNAVVAEVNEMLNDLWEAVCAVMWMYAPGIEAQSATKLAAYVFI